MQEIDTMAMCFDHNLEGPSLQNIRLMHPSHLIPSWPPRTLLTQVLGQQLQVCQIEAFRAVIPSLPVYQSLNNIQMPGQSFNFLNKNLAGNLYVFSIFHPRFGNHGFGSCVLCGTAHFSCRVSNHLLAYLPSTFPHIL